MFEGISSTTMPRNINWLPRLIVFWSTPMFFAKPSVSALPMFERSSWKTKRPRKSKGRTVVSTLSRQRSFFDLEPGIVLSSRSRNSGIILWAQIFAQIGSCSMLEHSLFWVGNHAIGNMNYSLGSEYSSMTKVQQLELYTPHTLQTPQPQIPSFHGTLAPSHANDRHDSSPAIMPTAMPNSLFASYSKMHGTF
jgi:hypothetical protein